jgi:hypothetical protein
MTRGRHPAFLRAESLDEPLRSHFPKSVEEAQAWLPMMRSRALASRVLVVAHTRIECTWAAYVDAVSGIDHSQEADRVLRSGAKLDESLARQIFPEFKQVPYAS